MSSSEIVPVVGKEYQVSRDGLKWVKRVFLYKNAFGAFVCQQKLSWSLGEIPALSWPQIREVQVEVPKMKKIIMVKTANEIMQYLLGSGYKPDKEGNWRKGEVPEFASSMWFYCGKEKPSYKWWWMDEWLYAEWVPVEEGE